MENVFNPISDKLLCKPIEQEEMSTGGILLPELDESKVLKAQVIEAGPGFWAAPSLFIKTTIKPGDIVVYQRFSAQTMELDGVDYHIIQERDVLGKLNK